MFKDAIKASEAFNEYASKPGKLEDKPDFRQYERQPA
jgi:hypothetical protein